MNFADDGWRHLAVFVYLAVSKSDRVERIKSGSVKCYVNGVLVADGKIDNRDDDLFIKEVCTSTATTYRDEHHKDVYTAGPNAAGKTNQTRYSFKAGFKPGELVRIEAEADDGVYKAYPKWVVPKAPEFSITDTLPKESIWQQYLPDPCQRQGHHR